MRARRLHSRFLMPIMLAAPLAPCAAQTDEPDTVVEDMAEDSEAMSRSTDKLIVPIPMLSPSMGFGVALAALGIYKVNDKEPAWTTGGGVLLTTRGSKAFGGYHRMSLGEDRIRLNAVAGHGSFNLTYYGTGENAGQGEATDLNQKVTVASLRGLVEVSESLYVGARLQYQARKTKLRDEESGELPSDIPPETLNSHIVSIGPALQFDTRDDQFAPRTGVFVDGLWSFSETAIGSDFSYSKLTLSGTAFTPMGAEATLAARVTLCRAAGDTPFFDLCLYGKSAALRGYEAGRYRDNFGSTAQVEYRTPLRGKLGLVVFGGIGFSGPDFLDFGDAKFLPAAGAGLRYRISSVTRMNVGLDAAVGRGDHGIYLTVGEAF